MAAPVYIATTGTAPSAACAAIEAYLPSGHGFDTVVEWSPIITEATAFVDARLSPRYWPFPDIAGTPATPPLIAALAARYGAYVALMKLAPASRFDDMSWVDKLRSDVTRDLDELCDEKLAAQVPMGVVTDEDIDAGTGYLSSEHIFGCKPRDVDPYSVAISILTTNYINGTDFQVYWQPMANCGNGAWVLNILNTAIIDGTHVGYSYSHIKRQRLDMPPSHDTIRLVRA